MRSIVQRREMVWLKAILLSVAYVLLYVLLDRVSDIHNLQHSQVTPWSPHIALMIAVAMYYGVGSRR
jgi:hypothetical protein